MVDTHPWNTGFAWRDHDWPPTTLSADDVRCFDERGYLVLASLFTAEELAPVVAELDRYEAKVAAHLDQLDDGRFLIAEAGAITFAPHLAARSATLARFARHPRLLGICRDLVGQDVDLYHDQAVYKKPEKPRRFPWHQDNGYKFVEPQSYLTCWVALTDATRDNGCPRVAPGLHRLGTLQHTYVDPLGWECFTDPDEVEVAAVPAGSVVAFSSLTPHLTGPNTTGAVRKAYILQYAPAGAVALEGDPAAGAPVRRVPQGDPRTQPPVLRHGRPVEPGSQGPVE